MLRTVMLRTVMPGVVFVARHLPFDWAIRVVHCNPRSTVSDVDCTVTCVSQKPGNEDDAGL